MRAFRAKPLAVMFVTTFCLSAKPATVSWVGDSGDWNDVTHWSTSLLPATNDDVVIDPGPAITVTHSSGTHSVNSIQCSQAFFISGGTLAVGTTFVASSDIALLGGTVQANDFSMTPTSIMTFVAGGHNPGTDYGQVVVAGTLMLAGEMDVVLTNGFEPSVGDAFRVLSWGTRHGGFSVANGFDLGSGLYFQGIADVSGLSLVTKTSVVPTPPPPTNLVNQVAAVGATASFCISPNGQQPFTYQWQFNGTNLVGQTNSSLVLTNLQLSSAGNYCVVVVDALDQISTYCATLAALNVPGFTGQPSSQTVTSGSPVTFAASASGSGPFRYQWRLNGENILGATNATYSITNSQPLSGGTLSVLLANPVGVVRSSDAKLVVSSPTLAFADNFANRGSISGPNGVGRGSNTNATREPGEPSPAGKVVSNSVWLKWTAPADGVANFNTRGSSFDTVMGIYIGTSVSNLTVVASDDDSGGGFASAVVFNAIAGTNYSIAVDGLAGAKGNIVLSWNLDTNNNDVPMISQQPASMAASAGGGATFNVLATAMTGLSYQWYFDDWLAIAGATNTSLTVSNAGISNVGTYSVEVTSTSGGIVDSQDAYLEIGPTTDGHSYDKIEDLLQAAGIFGGQGLIRFHPMDLSSFPSVSAGTLGSQIINTFNSTTEQGEPIHANVIGGSSRWYLLRAEGTGTLIIDTLGSDIATLLAVYTGNDIFSLALVAQDRNSATDGVRSRVLFPVASATNYLVAVDGVNGAQGNINLNWRMGVPPAFAGGSPAHLTCVEGTALSLEGGVTAGLPVPIYQWMLDGAAIPGAISDTYSVAKVQYGQGGTYSVLASNFMGTAVATVAIVTVQVPLHLLVDASFAPPNFWILGTATQAVVLQLSSNLNTWTPLFTNPTPNTLTDFLDTNAPSRDKGFYRFHAWP